MPNCVHGIDERFCANCRRTNLARPIHGNAMRLDRDNRGVLVIRETRSGYVVALTQRGLVELPSQELRQAEDRVLEIAARINLRGVPLRFGYLCIPSGPLTVRELREDVGPTHCYNCRTLLSYDRKSLGCTECHYYVCSCGRCLCGYAATNWKGEVFRQFPPLPIPWESRLDYVRAFRYLNSRLTRHAPDRGSSLDKVDTAT